MSQVEQTNEKVEEGPKAGGAGEAEAANALFEDAYRAPSPAGEAEAGKKPAGSTPKAGGESESGKIPAGS